MDHTKEPIPFYRANITEEDVDAVAGVLRSGWLTTGDQAQRFERELAAYLGTPHALAVSSCTHALEICLAHLGLPRGSRVGVPTWTFVSTALSGVHVGLTPVLLDSDESTLNLSSSSLRAAIQELDAVVPVHFAGVAVDDEVFEICNAHGVPIIEDAAHAFGGRDDSGTLVNGSRSLAACYSFYATKNLTSGEGGAIATVDDALAEFATAQRLHGMSRDAWRRYRPDGAPLYDLLGPGIKANFPDLLAALARSQLARFHRLQARRRELVIRYREQLNAIEGLQLVPRDLSEGSADHLMVVLLPAGADRLKIVQEMSSEGISTSVHFRPLHQFTWIAENAIIGPGGLSVADRVSARALSLPLFVDLTDDQVDRVCAQVRRSIERSGA
jgi:dTDP-4-amino-4,6-dideoxygalactose transaminase